jgi:serine/threonine protein kinase/tetratricopeptide (TPR) repeat protein
MIGRTISHYKIIGKLGLGGMGVVYKAEDLKLKRSVALKFLPAALTPDQEARDRFLNEARAVSRLEHKNICTVYDIDETDDGQIFITMACYEGETLKQKLKNGPLAPDEAANIARQVAQALSTAHGAGVVHRDIKPANIMVTVDGTVKILDFGLAKLAGGTQITDAGGAIGTAAYMSPEQAGGDEVDSRTDIWSLGVVLYEMLTARVPFRGEYDQAVLYAVLNEDPKPVAEIRPDAPPGLVSIVMKAMEKKKEARYAGIDDMLLDIRRYRREPGVSGDISRPAAKAPAGKFTPSARILIPAAFILVLAVLLLIFRGALFDDGREAKPKQITVISFENQSGDPKYDYLGNAIPNLLITSLEQSEGLRVTTWERLQDLLKQMGRDDDGVIDKELGFELCRADNVDCIVLGSFTKAGDVFATDVKVMNVNTKKIVKSASARGQGVASILESQIDTLSREISEGIGVSSGEPRSGPRRIADVTTSSMDAYHYFLEGRALFERIYFDEAREALEQAVRTDPDFAYAHLLLARACAALGDKQCRDDAFARAMALSGKASEKERLYIRSAYAESVENNRPKKLRILKKMAEKYPREKQVHYLLGAHYLWQNELETAVKELEKALALDPLYGAGLNLMAYTYAAMEDYEPAIEYFDRYAAVSPNDANPYDSMGDLYFRMGDLEQAVEQYQKALEIKPEFGSGWRVAYVYALKEAYGPAREWIDQNIALAPSPGLRADGFFWKAFYDVWLGNMGQALSNIQNTQDLATAIGNEGIIATGDWLRGWIYYDRGQYEASRAFYKSWHDLILEAYPSFEVSNTAYFQFLLGLIDLKQGRVEDARARRAEIDDLVPELDVVFRPWITYCHDILYSEILLADGYAQEAADYYNEIPVVNIERMVREIVMPYNIPLERDVAARAYARQGDLEKAIMAYEKLITFDPDSPSRHLIPPRFYYRLAGLFERTGRKTDAFRTYEKFLRLWKDADPDLPEVVSARAYLEKYS